MNELPIRCDRVRRSFGSRVALDGVSFEVSRPQIVALLGPNGAGKTTLVRCLTTLCPPDGGSIAILGHRVGREDLAIRRRIGVVFQDDRLDPHLTVRQNLALFAALHEVPEPTVRIGSLLEEFHLQERADELPEQLSGGTRRRLAIARAFVNDPAVLFLDEPTTGLDPQSRRDLWERIRACRGVRTVLITTHDMDEASTLADRILIMDAGRFLLDGSLTSIREEVFGHDTGAHKNLEDVFLELTGRRLRDGPLDPDSFPGVRPVGGLRGTGTHDDGEGTGAQVLFRGGGLRWWPGWVLAGRDGMVAGRFALVEAAHTLSIPLILFVIFGLGMQDLIGPVGSVPYLEFVVPGLVLMTAIFESFNHGAWSIWFHREKSGVLDAYRVAPVTPWDILLSRLISGYVLGVAKTVLVVICLALMWEWLVSSPPLRAPENPLANGFTASLAVLLFGVWGFTVGTLSDRPETIGRIHGILIQPLVLLGGMFFPLDAYPPGIREAFRCLPTAAAFHGLRAPPLGVEWWRDHVVLMGWVVLSTVVAVRVFLAKLR